MLVDKMKDRTVLKKQYKNNSNLDLRKNFHKKYSTNKQGYKNWIMEQYKFFDGCKILELGCGMGSQWKDYIHLIGENSTLILSDLSEGMVKDATIRFEGCSNVEVMQIDIEDIPFEEHTFDFVIADSMLYHVPNLEKALKEVKRILKKSGTFYATTYGKNGLTKLIRETMKYFKPSHAQKENDPFTLQNGGELLEHYFNSVKRLDYKDGLYITETEDLVNYMLSMSSMISIDDIDQYELLAFYNTLKNENQVIYIPKEYGMFIATK